METAPEGASDDTPEAGELPKGTVRKKRSVSKHLTRNNVVRRQYGLTVEEAAEAVKMHCGGISMRAIARTLGVDRKHVRASLVAAGSLALQQSLNTPLE